MALGFVFLLHEHDWTSIGWRARSNVPFWRISWIWCFIFSFYRRERRYIIPLGKGALGFRLIECLTWQCKGTLIGEVKMSQYFSTTLSTWLFCVQRPCSEAIDVVVTFHSLWEQIMKRKNFPFWEMAFLHYLAEIKENTIGGSLFDIL